MRDWCYITKVTRLDCLNFITAEFVFALGRDGQLSYLYSKARNVGILSRSDPRDVESEP